MRTRRSGCGGSACPAHCDRTREDRRILPFQHRVGCGRSRAIIQSRSRRGRPREGLKATRDGRRPPISCPCSLQRIPDVRAGKLPLTSSPGFGRPLRPPHPGLEAIFMAPSSNEADQKLSRSALIARVLETRAQGDELRAVRSRPVCGDHDRRGRRRPCAGHRSHLDLNPFSIAYHHEEANMNLRTACGVLILAGLMAAAAPSTRSQAQPNTPAASAPKDIGGSAPKSAAPRTNMTPTKHRYWRHRGGRHPHYGARRVRT